MTNQAAQTMPVIDDFNGDNAKLIESARALIRLSDSGSLAPHGIGGHARAILSAFIVRTEAAALSQTAGVAEGWKLVPVEPTEEMCEAAMSSLGWSRSQAAATAAPITPASPMMEGAMKVWSGMLAAAPAASGVHPDALPDGTLSKSTAKRVTALAAASVSERDGSSAHCIGGGNWSPWDLFRLSTDMKLPVNLPAEKAIELRRDIERALEQALTQQRGEAIYQFRDAYGAWRDTTKSHYQVEDRHDKRILYTTPQPSADAVRELVSKMYGGAVAVGSDGQWVSVRRYLLDELESLISGGSHA